MTERLTNSIMYVTWRQFVLLIVAALGLLPVPIIAAWILVNTQVGAHARLEKHAGAPSIREYQTLQNDLRDIKMEIRQLRHNVSLLERRLLRQDTSPEGMP